MRQNKPILVALGLYVPGTSFTRVFDTLFSALSTDFEIHWPGIAYKGPVQTLQHYVLHPNNLEGGDIFGAYGAARLATELNAECVLFINDVWMMKNYADVHRAQPWRTVAYVPLDGRITDPADISELSFLDTVVAYHADAQRQFTRAFDTLVTEHVISSAPALEIAFHGVDTDVFTIDSDILTHPGRRRAFREIFFNHLDGWEDTVFVLNANRFNERKDLRTSLAAFAEVLKLSRVPVQLCLHVPAIEAFQLDILRAWVSEFHLEQHVIINPASEHGFVDDGVLKALYCACDIGINTSFGEGWGLISFEHAACGGAQIVPAQSGLQEIWQDNALFIESAGPVTLGTNPFEMQRSSASSLAQLLAGLVNAPDRLVQMQLRAHAHAHRKEFRWEAIAGQWRTILAA